MSNPTSTVALTGNPNCGKTTLFNALTGLRAKVGNYAGVTVERKEGRLLGAPAETQITILDLPGTYSLSPQSLDEQISRDILFHRLPEVPAPSVVVVVIDASNLQRNLYYATQIIELGYPTIIALNMIDVAENNGHFINANQLSAALGVPVIPLVASNGKGVPELSKKIVASVAEKLGGAGDSPAPVGDPPTGTNETILQKSLSTLIKNAPGISSSESRDETSQWPVLAKTYVPRQFCELPEKFGHEAEAIEELLEKTFHERKTQATAEALLILSDEKVLASNREHYPAPIETAVTAARARLEAAGVDWRSVAIEARYARASAIQMAVTIEQDVV
ncbi:MAG: 50S ribosome-binding GTPase, partial [Verrucomicrobiota bacterium]|nr:50S ribosome-binding GTPase [Verrucomicrobiota bacterium]